MTQSSTSVSSTHCLPSLQTGQRSWTQRYVDFLDNMGSVAMVCSKSAAITTNSRNELVF